MTTIDQFKAARRVGAPIIIYKTPDPAASIDALIQALNGSGNKTPLFRWDVVRGVHSLNDLAAAYIQDGESIISPVDALIFAGKAPGRPTTERGSVFFALNAHRAIADGGTPVIQAIWNLRDSFKSDGRTLVLICNEMQTPAELANDVITIDEPLPDPAAIQAIVVNQACNAGATLGAEDAAKATDALCGLSAFAAEQSVAMSFQKEGKAVVLNLGEVWERKRQAIEETRGLRVYRGAESFASIGGVDNVKGFLGKIIKGRKAPRSIVFIDEIEKALAGSSSDNGDTSGTSQDQLGVLLKEMQDNNAEGILFIGHPGSAKSMVAKATGNAAGVPTIELDLGAMKGGIVGESQANIRAAVKVIQAVSQGSALYIATCNKIGAIPPELQRRFTLGTFFFDLPSKDERTAIWKLYGAKYDLKPTLADLHASEGWTGADIASCCNRAWMFSGTIAEAANYATPLCKTRPQEIEALRKMANGAFISASEAGLYRMAARATAASTNNKRQFEEQ
jgi:hypothetical protein